MSDPVMKSVRKPSRATSVSPSAPAAKNRKSTGHSVRSKPTAKGLAAEKAPARKATKPKLLAASSGSSKTDKKQPARSTKHKKAEKRLIQAVPAGKAVSSSAKKETVKASAVSKSGKASVTKSSVASTARQTGVPAAPRQPTRDEAAALQAFERARKEFTRGRFTEASGMFRALIERFVKVPEVAARARTYLSVSEARLQTERALPRDADSLYDRGVVELNRGEYVAAQEMFERALKREPASAHVHYSLAATRARLGSIGSALESLERALDLQPTLRVRAQHDQDLATLRNEPDFERLVFASRS